MISCKEYAEQEKLKMKEYIETLERKPVLGIVLVGNDYASLKYTTYKQKDCKEVGIVPIFIHLDESTSQTELINQLMDLQLQCDGVILQQPCPLQINVTEVLTYLNKSKDVDGLTKDSLFIPATPLGILNILKANKFNLVGADVCIIGRGKLVGMPLAHLLQKENCTVTLCHSKTPPEKLKQHTLNSDIIVSCVGNHPADIVTSDMVSQGSIVIDAGIGQKNGVLCGDVDYENVKDKCKFITKCKIDSVGVLTRLSLLQNTMKAYGSGVNQCKK